MQAAGIHGFFAKLPDSYFDALVIVINFIKNPEGIEQ